MRLLIIGMALAGGCMLSSCKKSWTCECKNANSTYTAGVIEDATKRQAKKSCGDLSTADTECSIK